MQAFLLEDEVSRGTRLLTNVDGTKHSMNRVFLEEEVSDIIVARRFLSQKILRFLASHSHLKRNVLACTILADDLNWSDLTVES